MKLSVTFLLTGTTYEYNVQSALVTLFCSQDCVPHVFYSLFILPKHLFSHPFMFLAS